MLRQVADVWETMIGQTPKGERVMATVRTHRYTLGPGQVETFLAQRAELIGQGVRGVSTS